MGQRANLIVVENGEYELYYDHWCANSLDSLLFWGPESALRFFRAHDSLDEDGWLDTKWCEGGAVIDVDKSTLVFFGGEDILYDVFLRRTFLDMLLETWPGYSVSWAYDGIVDLAEYVGHEPQSVIVARDRSIDSAREYLNLHIRDGKDYTPGVLLSVRHPSVGGVYPVGFLANRLVWCGERMLDALSAHTPIERYDFSPTLSGEVPCGGVHVDALERHVYFWQANLSHFDLAHLRMAWPGWKVEYGRDCFERHLRLADGRLNFVPPDREKIVDAIRQIVCRGEQSTAPDMDGIAALLAEKGHDVQINPAARQSFPTGESESVQERRFAEIAARFLNRKRRAAAREERT